MCTKRQAAELRDFTAATESGGGEPAECRGGHGGADTRAGRGESLAQLGELSERLRPELAAFLARRGIPPCDAEDVVQQALAAAAQRWATITEMESWLRGTVRWKSVVYWRQRRRSRLVLTDPADLDLRACGAGQGERRDLRIDLRRLCGGLSGQQRRLLVLRFGRGMRLWEVARALGISVSSVLREEQRAVAELRALAAGGGPSAATNAPRERSGAAKSPRRMSCRRAREPVAGAEARGPTRLALIAPS
jgi:RNA polymerase sigma factor (sigma-70 family)